MRLRTLLAATAASTLASSVLAIGAVGIPARAATAPPPAGAGALLTWGDENDVNGKDAIPVPEELTGLVTAVAANTYATGVVTLDGAALVWGKSDKSEVGLAPDGINDATAIALTTNNGAVLHADGHITAWGDSTPLSDVNEDFPDLRAKAIALQGGTGYAVRPDGSLAVWGGAPIGTVPTTGLTDLVDVSATATTHALALHADGGVTTWGAAYPGLLDVPSFGGKKAVKIATGTGYSGVVFEDGTIDIWGFSALIPAGEPTFNGLTPAGKVVDLSLGSGTAAAVTADGAVHVWGTSATLKAVPGSLTGQPVSAVALGTTHAAAVITTFRDLTKPTITGQPAVGQTLTATPATLSLTPDAPATGQWYAGADPIAGQTATTLALGTAQLGKQISYRTTATRGDDSVTSTSNELGPVTPAISTTTVSVSRLSAAVGSTRTATATVTATGAAPTGTVTFTLDSTTATAALTAGKATWTLPTNLKVGSHRVTAAYSGDTTTIPSTSTAVNVTVTKAAAKIKAAKPKINGKTKKVAKKVTIALTVKTAKGVSPAGKVTISLNGKTKKTVNVKVNAKGKATATFKNVKHGNYKAQLKYRGNAKVKPSHTTKKFKV